MRRSERCRRCVYRGTVNGQDAGCAYLQITGKSRLAKAYKRLGVDHLTDEVRELMRPARCLCFVTGPRRNVEERHEILLDGSRPRKKTPTVWPEAPKIGETR